MGETEGLGQRVAGHEDGLGAPDHLHHGHADDAVLDDALDAGDDQRIVDLQAGPGRVDAVGHLHDPVAVAGVGRDGEGGADPTGLVADQVAGHHLAVAAQHDAGLARGEVDAGDGDAGLAAPPEVGRDLQHGRGLVEHRVGVDVALLGPVVLFHQHGLVARQQRQAAEEARVAARLIDREHGGVRNAVRRDETGDLVDPGVPFGVVDVRLGGVREVVRVDAFLGLGVPVLQLVVHLVLGVVVLQVLDVLNDVVDLVHGDAGQAEVADLHVGGVGRAIDAAQSQGVFRHDGQLREIRRSPFQPFDLGGGGVNDVAATEVIVVVQAAVGAVHRLVAEAAAPEVDHVEVAQLELDRRHGESGRVGGRRRSGADLLDAVVDVGERIAAQFHQALVVGACAVGGGPVDAIAGRAADRQPGELVHLPGGGGPGNDRSGVEGRLAGGVVGGHQIEIVSGRRMVGLSEPAAVHVVGALDHLLGVGPAHRVGGADGRFVAGAEPVDMVARLLPVHALLEDGRALADLEDVHDGIGVEQVFAAAHRAASDVAGDLDDGLHLGRLLERRGVDRIAALVDVEGLLLAAHRLGSDGFGHQGRGGQIALMPEALDVGASGVGDRLHAVVIDAADEGVEAPHQIASGLVEGALGQVLNQ